MSSNMENVLPVYGFAVKPEGGGGSVTPEQIQQAVDAYLEENPVQPGATVEQVAQIEKNKTDISELSEDITALEEEDGIRKEQIDGSYSGIKTLEFANYEKKSEEQFYVGSNTLMFSKNISVDSTSEILVSDLPDIVFFKPNDIGVPAIGVKRSTGDAVWTKSNLPTSFVTVDEYGYATVNVKYLKDNPIYTHIAFSSNTEELSIKYDVPDKKKNLDWLLLTDKNFPNKITILTVGSDKQYQKIQDAINDAYDGFYILVDNGLYEESLDIGTKDISLIGNNVIVYDESGEYEKAPIICGSGYIKGFTFIERKNEEKDYSGITRFAYACHLDKRWGGSKHIIFENCNFISDFASAIGCGVIEDVHIVLINCDAKATKETASAFQIHGDASSAGNAIIDVKNCKFLKNESGNGHGILLSNGGADYNTGTTITMNIDNTFCDSFYNNCADLYIKGKTNFGNNLAELNS